MMARHTILTLPLLASISALGCTDLVDKLTKDKSVHAGDVAPPSAASSSPASTPLSDAASSTPATTTTTRPAEPAKTGPSPTARASASRTELDNAFAALDINDDDQLDGIEVRSCGCAVADANGDGEITKAEYLAAGLAGKISPGGAPAPTPAPTSTSTAKAAPANPPAPPQGGSVPPGLYKCAGSVGGTYMTTGRVVILDAQRYATGADGTGQGTYRFFPETGQIVFASGPNADLATVSYARLVAPTRIQMKTGKNGRNLWDCKR